MKILASLSFSLLFVALIVTSGCKTTEDPDPCNGLVCQNGGEIENCECSCPIYYSGEQCEIFDNPCTVECPAGQTANPNKDCVCE